MSTIVKKWGELSNYARDTRARWGGSILYALGKELVARIYGSAALREFQRRRELYQNKLSKMRPSEGIDKELLSTPAYLEYYAEEESYPETLLIEPTTRCNLQCVQCQRSSEYFEKGDMEWETFQKILPLIKKAKNVILYACGEPFLHPRYLEMIKTVKDLGVRVSTTTNGTTITSHIAERIVQYGLDCLSFSIDAVSDQLFSTIRRGARLQNVICNFREVVKLRKKMESNLPRLAIEFVAIKMNIHELPQMVDLAGELEADTVLVANLAEFSNVEGQSILRDLPSYKGYIFDAMKRARERGVTFDVHSRLRTAIEDHGEVQSKRYIPDVSSETDWITAECEMPWNFAFITWDGNIKPCCDIGEHFGNLKSESFERIWKNEKYFSLRKGLLIGKLRDECRDCAVKRLVRIEPIESFVEMGVNDGLEGSSLSRQLGYGWRNRDGGQEGAASPPFRWTYNNATAFLRCDSNHTMLWIEASGGSRSVDYEVHVDDKEKGVYAAPRNRFVKSGIRLSYLKSALTKVTIRHSKKDTAYSKREQGIAVRRIWLA